MAMNLFEMKSVIASLEADRKSVSDWIDEKAADPNVKMEELEEKQAQVVDLTKRIELLKASAEREEEIQRARVASKEIAKKGGVDQEYIKNKAAFFRAAIRGGDLRKAYEGLGGLPSADADLGNGSNLLPTNLSNELITEPVEDNTLRQIEPVSQITGLEEPRLLFTIEDEDLEDVTDKQTAKEIEMEGDSVAYGRYKTKIKATVKDTVMHGTDLDLVTTIENGLRSGLAVKEKMRAFAPATGTGAYDADHKHMSFYAETDGTTDIEEVEGTDIIDAIVNAWADLPEIFAANATCVMRKQDYYKQLRVLANNNSDLWGKKPEDVIGIPVVFNDRAVTPVIGDFRYSKQNYDIDTIYDTDKDVSKGEYYFVVTAWGDHQIRLKSAFRLAMVSSGTSDTGA